jgi:threonine/homoserine/homoserine lactone efflux protein
VDGLEAGRLAEPGQAARDRLDIGFWQGVALQFVNIKAWMLALALAAGWVTSRQRPAGSEPDAAPGDRPAPSCSRSR